MTPEQIKKAAQLKISDQFEAKWTATHKQSQNKNGEKR